jgi:hypothetical protein
MGMDAESYFFELDVSGYRDHFMVNRFSGTTTLLFQSRYGGFFPYAGPNGQIMNRYNDADRTPSPFAWFMKGTPSTLTLLNPPLNSSALCDVSAKFQVGWTQRFDPDNRYEPYLEEVQAAYWKGSAQSQVRIAPHGSVTSIAQLIAGTHIFGTYGKADGTNGLFVHTIKGETEDLSSLVPPLYRYGFFSSSLICASYHRGYAYLLVRHYGPRPRNYSIITNAPAEM